MKKHYHPSEVQASTDLLQTLATFSLKAHTHKSNQEAFDDQMFDIFNDRQTCARETSGPMSLCLPHSDVWEAAHRCLAY